MYRITKKYENQTCRNCIDVTDTTFTYAVTILDMNQRLWRKHGGIVVSRKTKRQLICQESDGSETITWTIEKLG